jgi:hypothetical protein
MRRSLTYAVIRDMPDLTWRGQRIRGRLRKGASLKFDSDVIIKPIAFPGEISWLGRNNQLGLERPLVVVAASSSWCPYDHRIRCKTDFVALLLCDPLVHMAE